MTLGSQLAFLLRLVMLVSFGVFLAATGPHLWFLISHPGLSVPPSLDYHLATVHGVRFYVEAKN